MSPQGRYAAGIGMVLGAGILVGMAAEAGARNAIGLAVATAGVVQGPLGWWLIRSIGTDRFVAVWGVGILARFLLLAVLGFRLAPAAGVPAVPALVTYVPTVVALLFVEAYVVHTAQVRG